MNRFPALISLSLLPLLGAAQCQIQSFSVDNACGPNAPLAIVQLAGGSLPYQLTFTGNNGVVLQEQSFVQGSFTTYLPTSPVVMEPPVTLVVTDAIGCVASDMAYFQTYLAVIPEVWCEQPCPPTSSTLFWSGGFNLAGTPGVPSPCGMGLSYWVVSTDAGIDLTGTIQSGWTQLSNGIWRFNTALLPGYNYTVTIHPTFSPIGCDGGSVFYCYATTAALASSSTADCGQQFHLRAALGGALPSGTLMNDHLRAANLIPPTEPFTALGYTYTGSPAGLAISSPFLLTTTGNNAIVDWVLVELRSASTPATVLYSAPMLVQRDGDVVGVDGSTFLRAPLPPDMYHLAIRHRNHLSAMTASPRWLNKTLYFTGTTDLRNGSLAMYGSEPRKQVGSIWCLWPGEATGDGVVKYTGGGNDRDAILQAIGGTTPTNAVNNVYDRRDVNLDGSIKYTGSANDRDVILQTIGGTVPTATRTQELP